MAFETITPNVLLQQANLTGAITDIDDDPDSPDGLWLAWDGSGQSICRGGLLTPTGNPTTGADKQEFRVLIRNASAGSNSTTWALQLYENNSKLGSDLATGSDPSESGVVVSGTWDASLLGTASGVDVEIRLQQTAGASGNPGNQKGIEVGAMEWNVEYDVGGGTDVLLAEDIESASEVTTPVVGQKHVLLADDVESASETGTPVVRQKHVLLADDVESASETGAPVVGQKHVLLADDVESASEVTAPVLAEGASEHTLLADDIESASEVTTPAVGQKHILLADDVESASEVGAPTVGQKHVLLADDIESASELTKPVVAEKHNLLADDIESASEVSLPTVGEVHGLLADNVESLSEVSVPILDFTNAIRHARRGWN